MTSFQPTHPHGVRLVHAYEYNNERQVSTHAPARGATQTTSRLQRRLRVSTHAPARGATSINTMSNCWLWCFNPRTRTGCDVHEVEVEPGVYGFNPRTRTGCDEIGFPIAILVGVSTHAPARGATPAHRLSPPTHGFQPTHPHGVRRTSPLMTTSSTSFNPRTRTGCDISFPT